MMHSNLMSAFGLVWASLLVASVCAASASRPADTLPRFVMYIDSLGSWWPPTSVAQSLGVPGYGPATNCTVINLSFWTTGSGPVDAALVWSNPLHFVSAQNPWGSTNEEIRAAWLTRYHAQGTRVLVSAFGATDMPTTGGADPVATAKALASFVIDNQLDGVDLDYEDNAAMNAGKGEAWVIACTQTLRSLLPASDGYVISHAPQAPYFAGQPKYPSGGYLTVFEKAGSDIDFVNIQFYNQGSSQYETAETLFHVSDGWAAKTSIAQIAANGIPLNKLVVGKPVTQAGVVNTGYVSPSQLESMLAEGVSSLGWKGGVMGWQLSLDLSALGGKWFQTLSHAFE